VNKCYLVFLAVVFSFFPFVRADASVYGNCLVARGVIDEVLAQARVDPARKQAALRFLRVVADGSATEIDGEMLLPFRIREEVVDLSDLSRDCARQLAYLAIGKLASPAAWEYLDATTESQFPEEERTVLWPTVRIARYEWKLAALPDTKQRVEFLVAILRARRENDFEWAPEGWALDELCVMGDIGSLAELEAAIHRNVAATQRAHTLRLCRDIAYLVSSQPDRVTALSSALQIDGTKFSEPLMTWVISELGRMRTAESRAALEGFVHNAASKGLAGKPDNPTSFHVGHARLYLQRFTH
jgi:hypothetical protein